MAERLWIAEGDDGQDSGLLEPRDVIAHGGLRYTQLGCQRRVGATTIPAEKTQQVPIEVSDHRAIMSNRSAPHGGLDHLSFADGGPNECDVVRGDGPVG